jgi:hypothetical protein
MRPDDYTDSKTYRQLYAAGDDLERKAWAARSTCCDDSDALDTARGVLVGVVIGALLFWIPALFALVYWGLPWE